MDDLENQIWRASFYSTIGSRNAENISDTFANGRASFRKVMELTEYITEISYIAMSLWTWDWGGFGFASSGPVFAFLCPLSLPGRCCILHCHSNSLRTFASSLKFLSTQEPGFCSNNPKCRENGQPIVIKCIFGAQSTMVIVSQAVGWCSYISRRHFFKN